MPVAKVTSKGQVTIPKKVRQALGIAPGDELEFVEVDGEYRIQRHVTGSVFERYLGHLKRLEGHDPDEIVKELRGHQ